MPAITKLEAARRQLVTAIRLYFNDADSISVYTLAHAAWEVLDRLCKHEGKERFYDLMTESNAITEREIREIANYGRNFFKHADRDPDDVLADFSDDRNDGILFAAAFDYAKLATAKPVEVQIFETWFLALHPEWTQDPAFAPFRELMDREFPSLPDRPRAEQKGIGRQMLANVRLNSDIMNDPLTDGSPSGSLARSDEPSGS